MMLPPVAAVVATALTHVVPDWNVVAAVEDVVNVPSNVPLVVAVVAVVTEYSSTTSEPPRCHVTEHIPRTLIALESSVSAALNRMVYWNPVSNRFVRVGSGSPLAKLGNSKARAIASVASRLIFLPFSA